MTASLNWAVTSHAMNTCMHRALLIVFPSRYCCRGGMRGYARSVHPAEDEPNAQEQLDSVAECGAVDV